MASVPASLRNADARSAATIAAVIGVGAAIAPVVITLVAVVIGPFLPYPVGALVSYALVAACVALAVIEGVRALRLLRAVTAARAPLPRLRGAAATMPQPVDRALMTLRIAAIAAIVFGALHGLLLLGSLALTVPGILWHLSIGSW